MTGLQTQLNAAPRFKLAPWKKDITVADYLVISLNMPHLAVQIIQK